MSQRLALFIDYQNLHNNARERFTPWGTSMQDCVVNPVTFAHRLVHRRSVNIPTELAFTRVYRGRPSPEHEGALTAHVDRQNDRWGRDPSTTVITRQLDYRGWPDQRPREKGIDVKLVVDVINTALTATDVDAIAIASNDKDLVPAIEFVFNLHGTDRRRPRIEVACWTGVKPLRLAPDVAGRPNLPWCHFMTEEDFSACRER